LVVEGEGGTIKKLFDTLMEEFLPLIVLQTRADEDRLQTVKILADGLIELIVLATKRFP